VNQVYQCPDQAFVARVAEFSSLAAQGVNQQAALREIKSVVWAVIEDLKESDEPVPEPTVTEAKVIS